MAIEIERKFLVDKDKWASLLKPKSKAILQGYLSTNPDKTIRVRVKEMEAYLTIKGKTKGLSRTEIECKIPVTQAREMLQHFASAMIDKERYEIHYGQHIWEVDVFHGENEGLIVAEIELKAENETFEIPDWVAQEVSDDQRYYNSNLSLHPFTNWSID